MFDVEHCTLHFTVFMSQHLNVELVEEYILASPDFEEGSKSITAENVPFRRDFYMYMYMYI